MNKIAEEILMHYGTKFHSGRYPYGSGDDPYQHGGDFLSRVDKLRKENFTYTDEEGKTWKGDTAIAKSMGLSTSQFRTEVGLASDERRIYTVNRAKSLKKKGLGATEIGREMGLSESTVRSLLNQEAEARMNQARNTADFIKKQIDTKGMIDIGVGVERELGVSKEKLNQALYLLEREGYPVYAGRFEQATNPGHMTTQKVICPPGTKHQEIYNLDKVHALNEDGYVSRDGGETFSKFVYPKSMDSSRLMIRYAEEGGVEKDGIVELRRGVPDLSLGDARYSQVRILVDDKKYIKGMAVYSDDMPDGVDVVFNTNKKLGTDKLAVLKDIKNNPENPFGSLIQAKGQSTYIDKDGNEQLSLINKTRDEGDWSDWKDTLPSQFLSKQSLSMAKKQLNIAAEDRMAEFKDICELTNPTVKKYLLQSFSDDCDAAAVHLKAAALPGQKYHVIIPVNSLKDNEVYAPNYDDGTKLALIRYPHGGTFEIPILTVNNKHAAARKLLGTDIVDAIGINSKNAERLSGADFDGDTVMCIPTHDRMGKVKITSTPKLKELEGFDPKAEYPERPGMRYMKNPITGKDSTQVQMGMISNLICDMTLAGAPTEELARAVKHSMVVIDAGKHKLDYKQSEIDNGIAALHKNYQGYYDDKGRWHNKGAGTIISRAKGEVTVDKRQGNPIIDPETGKVSYKLADDLYYPVRKYNKESGEITLRTTEGKKITYKVSDKDAADKYEPIKNVDEKTGEVTFTNKDGTISYKTSKRTQPSSKMMETDDAYTLVSDARHPMELVYADYANKMKSLANEARKEMMATGNLKYNATAAKTYAKEVDSIKAKLNTALLNAPRERAAQRAANAEVNSQAKADSSMKSGDIKKAKQQALTKYRQEVGAVARRDRAIHITDKEWEAIQAGAISENYLTKILRNADSDNLRQLATPRSTNTLSQAKINRIKAYSASNYTTAEIARMLGVSPSTVSNYMKGAK